MKISEEEKKEILSKYDGNTSDDLLNYLKRRFPLHTQQLDWMDGPLKFIFVDDKMIMLRANKKYLVGKITSLVEDTWMGLGAAIIRRTVKKYIDGLSL